MICGRPRSEVAQSDDVAVPLLAVLARADDQEAVLVFGRTVVVELAPDQVALARVGVDDDDRRLEEYAFAMSVSGTICERSNAFGSSARHLHEDRRARAEPVLAVELGDVDRLARDARRAGRQQVQPLAGRRRGVGFVK